MSRSAWSHAATASIRAMSFAKASACDSNVRVEKWQHQVFTTRQSSATVITAPFHSSPSAPMISFSPPASHTMLPTLASSRMSASRSLGQVGSHGTNVAPALNAASWHSGSAAVRFSTRPTVNVLPWASVSLAADLGRDGRGMPVRVGERERALCPRPSCLQTCAAVLVEQSVLGHTGSGRPRGCASSDTGMQAC